MNGTRITLVTKADAAHMRSSVAPVVRPRVSSTPTKTTDWIAYHLMADGMVFETTTMVEVTIRRPPRILTNE